MSNGYDNFDLEIISRLTRIEEKLDGFGKWQDEHEKWSLQKAQAIDLQLAAHEAIIQQGKGIKWLLGALWFVVVSVIGWVWHGGK